MTSTRQIVRNLSRSVIAALVRRRAVRLAAQGDHVGALRLSRDVEVLSRLGLHLSVQASPAVAGLSAEVAFALAEAELGDGTAALDLVRLAGHRLGVARRTSLILAAGRWHPAAAFELSAGLAPAVRAALAWCAGWPDTAEALLATAQASGRQQDADLLRASIAAGKGQYQQARRLTNGVFAAFKLPAPLEDVPTPMTLDAFRAARPSFIGALPEVSVIMPVKSMAETVKVAVRSVLDQSGVAVELIVVDDASTDDTADRVEAIARQDHRVRLHRLSKSGGTYAARNRGLAAANGRFVAFNDADDWSHPERLLRQIDQLTRDQSLVATESRMVRLSDSGYFVAPRIYPLIRANRSSLAFRRKILDRIGGFDEVPFGADEEFTARICASYGPSSVRRLAEPLAVCRQSTTGLTGAAKTGIASLEGVRARIAYREAWVARHVSIAAQNSPSWGVLPKQLS